MIRAVPSRYNVFVPLSDGRKLGYNAFSGAEVLLSADDLRAYETIVEEQCLDPRDAVSVDLARNGFVVPEGTDELAILEEEYKKTRFNPRAACLTIMTTSACNFGCDYCFQGADKATDVLRKPVRDAIIAHVKSLKGQVNTLGIVWYGGEPLLKPDVIEDISTQIIALAPSLGMRFEAGIVTNGYHLDGEMAKKLHSLKVGWAQVTLDGHRDSHDSRRHLLGGQKTFDRLLDNLVEAVDTNTLRISVRVNIDARNREGIFQLLDELHQRGLGGRANFGVYFAPVEAITEGCHNVADVTMSKDDYGHLEGELYRYALSRRLTGAPYPKRFHGNCGAVRPKGMVITPTGDIHKCWDTISMPQYRVGTIFEPEKMISNAIHQQWMQWTPFKNETCRNCKILPSCAGACAYKFVHATHTRGEAATLPCPSWKYNLDERLVATAAARGLITKADLAEDTYSLKPTDLCTDDFSPGDALPEHMNELLANLAKTGHSRLPVIA